MSICILPSWLLSLQRIWILYIPNQRPPFTRKQLFILVLKFLDSFLWRKWRLNFSEIVSVEMKFNEPEVNPEKSNLCTGVAETLS